MNALITHPRAHRALWTRNHPEAMIEHGGLLSSDDLARWACDICMAPLDPENPIFCVGGPEGHSLCPDCLAKLPELDRAAAPCDCPGCRSPMT
jgi:hypothetical protein